MTAKEQAIITWKEQNSFLIEWFDVVVLPQLSNPDIDERVLRFSDKRCAGDEAKAWSFYFGGKMGESMGSMSEEEIVEMHKAYEEKR